MKVGILTFQWPLNYGAILQLYSMYEYLRELGHDPLVVDYRPEYLHRLTIGYAPLRRYLVRPLKRGTYHSRRRRIDHFTGTRMRYSKTYLTLAELQQDPPQVDALIAGSDQIWNSELTKNQVDSAYFLNFGDANIRKIAYAASLGTQALTSEQEEKFPPLLSSFDSLSLRENSSISLLQPLTSVPIEEVADPTLLGNAVNRLVSGRSKRKNTLLIYQLGVAPTIYQGLSAQLRSSYSKIKVVWSQCPLLSWMNPFSDFDMPSIENFAGAFVEARSVMTNSFHGTVLSILNRCQFVTFSHGTRNTRMQDFLSRLNLDDHFLEPQQIEQAEEILRRPIEWDEVEKKLGAYRTKSENFIQRALHPKPIS